MARYMNININREIIESQSLELFLTISPSFILILIGLPSIKLLYILDEVYKPIITIKSIGHQWYWSYEYSDFINLEFDSYIIPTNEMIDNSFRLLDVDNRTVIPINSQIRILVSSSDVLHSWTIPSLGVKTDAVPGRLNQISFYSNRPGLFFGQCSEICGANHRFIPITIESVSNINFIKWIKEVLPYFTPRFYIWISFTLNVMHCNWYRLNCTKQTVYMTFGVDWCWKGRFYGFSKLFRPVGVASSSLCHCCQWVSLSNRERCGTL